MNKLWKTHCRPLFALSLPFLNIITLEKKKEGENEDENSLYEDIENYHKP